MFYIKHHKYLGLILAGLGAGTVNGLLGAGGGMVLVPLLSLLTNWNSKRIFSASVAIILPICLVSLTAAALSTRIPWATALPYLIGSAMGGLAAGLAGHRIPAKWLHRILGVLMLWGGIRYLC